MCVGISFVFIFAFSDDFLKRNFPNALLTTESLVHFIRIYSEMTNWKKSINLLEILARLNLCAIVNGLEAIDTNIDQTWRKHLRKEN